MGKGRNEGASRRGLIAAIVAGAAGAGKAAAAALPAPPPGRIWVCVNEEAWNRLLEVAAALTGFDPTG